MPVKNAGGHVTAMSRSLYRLVECQPEGGYEWWGWFETDKDAIHALSAIFKEYQRDRREPVFNRDGSRVKITPNPYAWIISRLGYMKPGIAISEMNLPWKTIYTLKISKYAD